MKRHGSSPVTCDARYTSRRFGRVPQCSFKHKRPTHFLCHVGWDGMGWDDMTYGVQQSRLLVQDCAAKLEAVGLRGAIQEVSMIKVNISLWL